MKKVAIYGKSLVASSIGASLQACPDLQVLSVDLTTPELKRQLREFQPQIIIFDMTSTRPEEMIGMLEFQPHLLLVVVDIGKGQAMVLSGQTTRALTTADLLQVVETYHDT